MKSSDSSARVVLRALTLACVALFLAGCAEDPPPADPPLVVENPSRSSATESPGSVRASATLTPVNGSAVRGQITAMRAVDAIVVVLEAEHLPEPGEYASEIRMGSCTDPGAVTVVLNPVVGLTDGTGSSTTLLEPDVFAPNDRLFVQVHGTGGAPLACGDLESDAS